MMFRSHTDCPAAHGGEDLGMDLLGELGCGKREAGDIYWWLTLHISAERWNGLALLDVSKPDVSDERWNGLALLDVSKPDVSDDAETSPFFTPTVASRMDG